VVGDYKAVIFSLINKLKHAGEIENNDACFQWIFLLSIKAWLNLN
jgi:hypothetical protein